MYYSAPYPFVPDVTLGKPLRTATPSAKSGLSRGH